MCRAHYLDIPVPRCVVKLSTLLTNGYIGRSAHDYQRIIPPSLTTSEDNDQNGFASMPSPSPQQIQSCWCK